MNSSQQFMYSNFSLSQSFLTPFITRSHSRPNILVLKSCYSTILSIMLDLFGSSMEKNLVLHKANIVSLMSYVFVMDCLAFYFPFTCCPLSNPCY